MKYVCVMRVINNEAHLAGNYTGFISSQGKTVYEMGWYRQYVEGFESNGSYWCLLEVEYG